MHTYPSKYSAVRLEPGNSRESIEAGVDMRHGTQRQANRGPVLCAASVLAAGVAHLLVPWPYLRGITENPAFAAWAAICCGIAGIVIGGWILSARRIADKRLLLTRRQGRNGFARKP